MCQHLKISKPTAAIYKEECTLCFDSQDSEEGLDVCLVCFNGSCCRHSPIHFNNSGHATVLNIKRREKATSQPPLKITKISITESNDIDKYEYTTQAKCLSCPKIYSDNESPLLSETIGLVMNSLSAQKQSEIKAWEEELTPCEHTKNLNQVIYTPQDHNRKCSCCELTENLWLCMICGNLGCGREQFGGTGGNGHGLDHFHKTKHSVAVKLGTITPEGSADVFCYSCGEERIDEKLSAHLAHFNIKIDRLEKTEKTMAEMQLEENLKFDFSMSTEDGKSLTPLFGPGYTGLKNLGNSCYIASVCQVLFSIDAIRERYVIIPEQHSKNCKNHPAKCYMCQMGKIVDGLNSGRYSIPTYDENNNIRGQDGVSPSMFKQLVGNGHPEFSSMRQQDAQEFMQHLLSFMEKNERPHHFNSTDLFTFKAEQRLQCLKCKKVRYRNESTISLNLRVPARKSDFSSPSENPQYLPVSFEEVLGDFFSPESREFNCPHEKESTVCNISTNFFTFPDILVCSLSRFVIGSNWVMEKLNVKVDVPEHINLEKYRGKGLQENESCLPDEIDKVGPVINGADLQQLTAMGFSENRSTRALLATGNNGAEIAMNWLFEHMDDPGIDEPLPEASGSTDSHSEIDINQIIEMGFNAIQAKRALKETNNNVERAVDWLFNHADEIIEEDDVPKSLEVRDSGSSNYQLMAFISHKGTSAHCGHYVAFVRKGTQWVLYNDNKVVEIEDIKTHIGEGYVYFFKRN